MSIRKGLLIGLLLVAALVAGCNGSKAAKADPAKAAALDFYKSFFLAQDRSHAWDLTTPEWRAGRAKTKEDWLKLFGDATPRPLGTYEIKEYPRGDDHLYLISDAKDRYLIWVTKTPDGWRIRRHEYYKGGEIPW